MWAFISLISMKDGAEGFPSPPRDDIAAERHHSAHPQFAAPLI